MHATHDYKPRGHRPSIARGHLLELRTRELETAEDVAAHAVLAVEAAGGLASIILTRRRLATRSSSGTSPIKCSHVAEVKSHLAALRHALSVVRAGVMRLVVIVDERCAHAPTDEELRLLKVLERAARRDGVVVLVARRTSVAA